MSPTGAPSGKPRLLVLASTYPRWEGDTEPAFVHELARRLTGDFEVRVLAPSARGAAPSECLDGVSVHRYRYAPMRFQTLVNDGGIVTNLRKFPWKWILVPVFAIALLWSTWRIHRAWKPHVIHAHWLLPQGLAAILASGFSRHRARVVVTSHGADLFALKAWPMGRLKRFVARCATIVTVVSTDMRNRLVDLGADATKIRVEPMGVDLAGRFSPDRDVERSTDEILFVGRMVEKKGLRHLIDAMPAILETCPSARLTIAGFGPEEQDRRRQVERLGLQTNITFLGAVSQERLPALYRRAAVFVAPFVRAKSGDQDGLGLVVIEAAGCECPVVVSDLPPVRDICCEQIRRVPPGSPTALADAVGHVLAAASTPNAACPTAENRLRERFDWTNVARRYSLLLRETAIPSLGR